MSEAKVDLLDLAGRVSDGVAVDWDEQERCATSEEERRMVRHLRLLDSVASIHRTQPEADFRDPLELSGTVESTLTEDMTLAPGELPADEEHRWGHLEIREKIGAGAFGEVFRAWDANLDREVALKLLKKEPSTRESLASSVLKEGRLLARVRHTNVVTVFGAETHDQRVGLWMELVRGRSLADLLGEQGKLGAREAALIGLDLCRALTAVHGAGLVHRDLKARNVMREEGGRILLMDFGAGRDLRDIEGQEDRTISGTPLYIAPEIYEGQAATPRSDVYSLGVLLFHLVTGTYPVQAPSLRKLATKHRRGETRLLRDERSDLPEAFVNVVERALERDPQNRFATAGQMEQALSAALGVESVPRTAEPDPPRSPSFGLRVGSGLAIASLVVVILVAVWLLPNRGVDREPDTPLPATPARPAERESAAPSVSEPEHVPGVATKTQAQRPSSPEGAGARPDGSTSIGPSASPAAASYTVEAALYRVDEHGGREKLESGARLSLGDSLSLELQASRSLYVYVINEDEQGRAWALFPLPGFDLANPLAANEAHRIPGRRAGKPFAWTVDSYGGREHFLVLASPDRLIEFEAEMDALPRPRAGQVAVPIPESARVRLRGIGTLVEVPDPAPGGSADRLFAMAEKLAGRSEVVEGAWVRRIELDNPAPD
jgi:serine/threonine protein kinase